MNKQKISVATVWDHGRHSWKHFADAEGHSVTDASYWNDFSFAQMAVSVDFQFEVMRVLSYHGRWFPYLAESNKCESTQQACISESMQIHAHVYTAECFCLHLLVKPRDSFGNMERIRCYSKYQYPGGV